MKNKRKIILFTLLGYELTYVIFSNGNADFTLPQTCIEFLLGGGMLSLYFFSVFEIIFGEDTVCNKQNK